MTSGTEPTLRLRRRNTNIEDLMAKHEYGEALRLAKDEVKRHPGDHRLLGLCAEIYVSLAQEEKAARVWKHVADLHASSGAPAKAVVALKRLERIDRDVDASYQAVASRIEQERTEPGSIPLEPLMLTYDGETEIPTMVLHSQTIESAAPVDLRAVEEDQLIADAVPSPLFDDFGREELLAFIKGLELKLFDAGDIIVAQGDPGDSLFIVTSGIVKAFVKRPGDGKYLRVRTLHDGDFFGEISILSGGPRTATITAATKCELLELNRATLDAITAIHPRVKEVMQEFYNERVASDRGLGA